MPPKPRKSEPSKPDYPVSSDSMDLQRCRISTQHSIPRANDAYEKECAKWEEVYGEKATPKAESMHEKLQRYQEKADRQNASQPYRSRDKGAR